MTKMIWILVADSTQARILSAEKPNDTLVEVENMTHLDSTKKPIDLVTDRSGRDMNSSSGSHGLGQEDRLKDREANIFAKELCSKLDNAYEQQKVRRLYLLAPPAMLGMIRKHISPKVLGIIETELDINMAKQDIATIRSHLPNRL